MRDKEPYIPPEAVLISFVPKERISTEDYEMTDENAFDFFAGDSRGAGFSGEVVEPED